jgi:hypothetical protein
MARVVHAVDVEIEGHLDPSLAKAVGMTEAQFKRLESAAKTFNSLVSKITVPSSVVTATEKIDSSLGKMASHSDQAARRVEHNFHRIAEEAHKAGETIQKNLAGAFDRVLESAMHMTGIGGLIGGVGAAFAGEEFMRGAFEVRAERGVLQNQLRTLSESQGRGFLSSQIDTLLRNMEGRETAVRYEPLLETTNMMLSAAPQRFQNIEQVHKMLSQLADVSRTPQAFAMVSQAFTRILAEGKVDAQHLNEMSIDTGFAFKKAMADALKVTPEQLSEMLKKHKIPGEKQIEALMQSFDVLTGPGGPAYHHAEAQLAGLAGLQERFIGHWRDFQESFGMQLENFISPIAEKVFSILTPAALTHAFDGLTSYVKGIATALASLVDHLQHGRAAAELQAIGTAFSNFFSRVFGAGSFAGFFKEVQDPINGIHTVLTETGKNWADVTSGKWADSIAKALETVRKTVEFISQHFEAIKNTLLGIFTAMGIAKATEVGKGVWDFAKAIWNIGRMIVTAGQVTVMGGAGGAAAEKAEGTVAKAAGFSGWGVLGGGVLAGVIMQQIEKAAYRNLPPGYSLGAESQKRGDVQRAQQNLDALRDQQALQHNVSAESIHAAEQQLAATQAALADYLRIKSAADQTVSVMEKLPGIASQTASAFASVAAAANAANRPSPLLPVPALTPVAPHAVGGIFTRPHIGLIAERGPEAIIPLRGRHGGSAITVNSNPTINLGAGGDVGSLQDILAEHARQIAAEVRRIFEMENEEIAPV